MIGATVSIQCLPLQHRNLFYQYTTPLKPRHPDLEQYKQFDHFVPEFTVDLSSLTNVQHPNRI